MLLKSRFIYEDGANEGGAGASGDAAVNNADASNNDAAKTGDDNSNTDSGKQPEAKTEFQIPDEIQAQLKELQELKEWKAANTKAPEKSPEEIAKENEADKANFIKFSVDNELFKIDEYTQYETLKVKADADLVFEGFVKDFKEENPDITDEIELSAAAKEAFDKEYKLSSTNEKAKEKGLAKLAKEANEIRNPYESKVKIAQTSYNEEKEVREKMPAFDKFIDEQIAKNAPDKVPFKIKKGETEVTVEIELTKEDKEALTKAFKTPKTFYSFSKSSEEAQVSVTKKINGWIRENKFEEALTKAFGTGESIGVKNGSNTGADAPFAMQQGQATNTAKILSLEDSNRKIAEARQRAAN